MRTLTALTLIFGFIAWREAAAQDSPADFNGIWMPTAIAPDGTRNRPWPEHPPFRPEVQTLVDRYYAQYDAVEDDDGRSCLPYGMPRQMLVTAQYPIEIIQTDQRLTILFELHNDVRRVFLDGRSHGVDLLPTWMGHSVGWFEEDTLVIETTGIRETAMPRPGSPELKVTDRISEIDGGDRGRMLTVDVTIDDPLVFQEPFTARNYYWLQTEIEMGEYFCSDDLWQQSLNGGEDDIPWR
ncbi:MAG: hypothetical protein PVF50_11900 [Gammaproteobacteria bacterium]|jgi:hypothetical protein